MRKKIIIYEFQDIRFASRARKEAYSLSKDYNVVLVGFNLKILKKSKLKINNNLYIIEYPLFVKNNNRLIIKFINIFFINILIGLYIIRTKADIYWMHNLKIFYPTIITKFIHGSKLIYDAHELHFAKRPNNTILQKLLTKYDIFKEKILVKYSDLIIQASFERAIIFSKFYKTKLPFVIENLANKVDVKSNMNLSIKKMLNLKESTKIIIFTGFITYNGNQKLENVIKSLCYLDSKIHFCILGSGNDVVKEKLKFIALENNVFDRFHILEPVLSDEVVSFISNADVAVIPIFANSLNSKYSALNKFSQSLIAGLPIACTNYDNLKKIIFNNQVGEIGAVFDVTNPHSISVAIEKCLNNQSFYSKNSRILGDKFMNWENQENNILNKVKGLFL